MRRGWFYGFFLVSGFCGLVYEIVWLRLAMAQFGITTPLASIVLSAFMTGLAAGSWGGGRLAAATAARSPRTALRLYALAELLIAALGIGVPAWLRAGRVLIEGSGNAAWNSAAYYLASGGWVSLALLPACLCMGATFPLAMGAMRGSAGHGRPRGFSYLYAANVLGAAAGTLTAAFVLIEIGGFRGTLLLAALLNVAIGLTALLLSLSAPVAAPAGTDAALAPGPGAKGPAPILAVLFITGLTSMAMEIVWVRLFTPHLGTLVYAFAAILAVYLGGTFVGSALYRRAVARGAAGGRPPDALRVWVLLGAGGLLPLLAADPRLPSAIGVGGLLLGTLRVAAGLVPFCAATGFLTPMLIDRRSRGEARPAGAAYAVNVVGCILGPLLASFWLLPAAGERGALVLLSAPLVGIGLVVMLRAGPHRSAALPAAAGALVLAIALIWGTRDYATIFAHRELRRDYEATVIAATVEGEKRLLVNGIGITALTPITKMMVHLPFAFRTEPPRRALVICFGMGTSFRSSLSWEVPTTAVELVPSVPPLIGYFHPDGRALLRSPLARVVIDDGRRLLEREPILYDVITIDPPPPIEAAGSSLLYSRDFYALLRRRLAAGGVLQQWFPEGEPASLASVARALAESFPHVRAFRSVEGWGVHFLASEAALEAVGPAELARRLPPRAAADLVEWWPGVAPEEPFRSVLSQEFAIGDLVALAPRAPALSDDHPYNEYFLLRRAFGFGF
jgi:predicted membrane-bound spermidine synthase